MSLVEVVSRKPPTAGAGANLRERANAAYQNRSKALSDAVPAFYKYAACAAVAADTIEFRCESAEDVIEGMFLKAYGEDPSLQEAAFRDEVIKIQGCLLLTRGQDDWGKASILERGILNHLTSPKARRSLAQALIRMARDHESPLLPPLQIALQTIEMTQRNMDGSHRSFTC